MVTLLALAPGLLAACTDDSGYTARSGRSRNQSSAAGGGSRAADLAGTGWALQSPVPGGDTPTLDFGAGGKLSGSTGCNRIVGSYTQDGAALRIELGPMTQRACTSAAATRQEQTVVSALAKVRTERRSGRTLTLMDGGGKELLVYSAVSAELAGTSWKVLGVNTGTAVVTSALTEKLTLEFGTDGTVSGNAGCGTFHGTYTQQGEAVEISGVAAAGAEGCTADVEAMQTRYLEALQAATTSTRSGSTLELRDGSGAMQVTATTHG